MIRNEITIIEHLKKHDKKLDRIEKLLSNQKEVLTIEDTVEFTGLSRSYIYKLVHWRKIPYSKPLGKFLYFQRQDLIEFLLRNRVAPHEEIEMVASNISMSKI